MGNNVRVLRRRYASYARIAGGSCGDAGKYTINDVRVCEAAANVLGVKHITATISSVAVGMEHGCYVDRMGYVHITANSTVASLSVDWEPVCSSIDYQMSNKY